MLLLKKPMKIIVHDLTMYLLQYLPQVNVMIIFTYVLLVIISFIDLVFIFHFNLFRHLLKNTLAKTIN
jgi:hypothetical protein